MLQAILVSVPSLHTVQAAGQHACAMSPAASSTDAAKASAFHCAVLNSQKSSPHATEAALTHTILGCGRQDTAAAAAVLQVFVLIFLEEAVDLFA